MHTSSESTKKPSPRQLRELRRLAEQRGQSFTYPKTSAEASTEIERLRGGAPNGWVERAVERRAVTRDMAARGGAATVRDSEIVGYGSSARWAVGE